MECTKLPHGLAPSKKIWLRPDNTAPTYTFSDCLISDNEHFMVMYTQEGLVESKRNNHHERNVDKSGKVQLIEPPIITPRQPGSTLRRETSNISFRIKPTEIQIVRIRHTKRKPRYYKR